MGHEHSKHSKSSKEQAESPSNGTHFDPRLRTAYDNLNSGNPLTFSSLEDAFGSDLGDSLWKFLSENAPTSQTIDFEQFSKYAARLMGQSTDIYVTICQPVFHLIKVASEAAGAGAVQGDERFINSLAEQMKSKGDEPKDILHWVKQEVPKFCEYIQAQVLHKCLGYDLVLPNLSSDILSPMQMWYLQAQLPSVYFPQSKDEDKTSKKQWTPLYASATQGISVNRFETNVFDYRGATVMILQLTDDKVACVAADQEWRHGSTRFGGPATMYIQISPSLKTIEASNSIYCNFKIRSAVFGLSFKEDLQLDKEMSNVRAIEVWGCASASTQADQQKLKQWQSKQAEKHKKVPLPGNWDDNPDKTIMEMAGFTFSNERQLMEEEARKNKDRERD